MDLNTLIWIIGISIVIQQHVDGHLFTLRSESNGQEAVNPKLTEIEEFELFFWLKQ